MTIPSPSRVVIPEDQETPANPNARISSLEKVIKSISESMEAMKKTNEDLVSRLPPRKQFGPKKGINRQERGKRMTKRKRALFTTIITPEHIAKMTLPTKILVMLKCKLDRPGT
jgi:hypothetical protein